MTLFLGVIIVVLILYLLAEKLVLNKDARLYKFKENEKMPYKITDSLLSNQECSFYNALKSCIGDKAVICPKVGLKDIFFIGRGVGLNYMKYFGKIPQKHADFLLCEPESMKPVCGIELDDPSGKESHESDLFMQKVFSDAGLELIRLPAKSVYTADEIEAALEAAFNKPHVMQEGTIEDTGDIVLCPKCNLPMVLKKSSKGRNAGKEYYECVNYPRCKEKVEKQNY